MSLQDIYKNKNFQRRIGIPKIRIRGVGNVPLFDAVPKKQYEIRRHVEESNKATLPFTLLKPERSLGAPWMDNFVARKKSVSLCPGCEHRYGKAWQIKHGYLPYRRFKELTDCDACSQQLQICTGFYHEESSTGKLIKKLI